MHRGDFFDTIANQNPFLFSKTRYFVTLHKVHCNAFYYKEK